MKELAPLLAAATALACSGPKWSGGTEIHGSLREVNAGNGAGTFALSTIASPHAVGIGVLADLAGEFVVYEGEVWIARSGRGEPARVQVTRGARPEELAAWIALSEVPEWRAFAAASELSLATLGEALAALTEYHGIESYGAVPFVLEGEFFALDAHVLAGASPSAGSGGPAPLRMRWDRAPGRLIGFLSELAPGVLAPEGSRVHVHVVVAGDRPFVGHVDAVRIPAGTRILVPAKSADL